MAKARKARYVLKTTLLTVGEGVADKAFIEHMKGIYSAGVTTQKVKVDAALGGSPAAMIYSIVRVNRHTGYDRKCLLIDTDIEITAEVRKEAKRQKIELIEATPLCLEGMLLDVLTQTPPSTTAQCKAILHPQLSGPETDKHSYSPLFDRPILDATTKQQIQRLITLLSNAA